MIQQSEEKKFSFNPAQFINNWVSVTCVSNALRPKVPFKKLKIFQKQKLTKSYEASIYRLYLEKIYLIAYAFIVKGKLQFSKKFYERNGLIFGLYSLETQTANVKKFKGIEMIQCELTNEQCFKEVLVDILDQLKQDAQRLQLSNLEQLDHSLRGVSQILDDKYVNPIQFLIRFEKLPLIQHYIHKVRLQNALLSSVFIHNNENRLVKKMLEQQKILDNIFYYEDSCKELYEDLSKIFEQIHLVLYNRGKIGTAQGPQFRKVKNYKGRTYERSFAIILSQYRMEIETNQKKMEQSQQQNANSNSDNNDNKTIDLKKKNIKDNKDKQWTKIQIKSKNGALQPISGNVIFVKFIWQVIPEEHKTFLEVHCCNNRKVQQIYYSQILQFWQKLEKQQRFRNLIGVDKYFIELNQEKQSMEVVFSNFIPNCMLTNTLREIDKIVSLALSMDQIIEICERKGIQKQGKQILSIKPYMLDEVINKFQWSLQKLQKQITSVRMN